MGQEIIGVCVGFAAVALGILFFISTMREDGCSWKEVLIAIGVIALFVWFVIQSEHRQNEEWHYGYTAGYEAAHDEWYEEGYENGYEEGYHDGINAEE